MHYLLQDNLTSLHIRFPDCDFQNHGDSHKEQKYLRLIFRSKMRIMHWPRASGPGVHGWAKKEPVRTGSNGVDFLGRPQAFAAARSIPSPCLLQKSQPPLNWPPLLSFCQLSPPPEKLNELSKFRSINCTKSFAQ